jgi:ABC-type multidrug transport system ATPase subunit
MIPPEPILEVEGAGRRFRGRVVLEKASFSAMPGRITAIMGRNGAGKSTLLRIAVGRVRPDHGRVRHRGRFLPRPSLPGLARSGILYLSHESALTPNLTIREHFGAFTTLFGGASRIPRALEALELVDLQERRPPDLSGGERRRAALGMAMVRRPECLLMDEPWAGLEPMDRELVSKVVRELKEAGGAVVATGHEVADVFQVADEVVWLHEGASRDLGPPREALEDADFRREYLGAGPPRHPGARGGS